MNRNKIINPMLLTRAEQSAKKDLVAERGGISRRAFLFAGAGLALGSESWSSLVDELTSMLGNKHARTHPNGGENLPADILPRVRRPAAPLPTREKDRVFLTFDDGPLHCTGQILDLLASTTHKATFFVLGHNLKEPKLRDFAIRTLREGHDIGNHSFSHPDFSRISAKRAEKEIVSTHDLIQAIVEESGVNPKRQNLFFRFPYGVSGSWANYAATQKVLASLGYRIAWWNLDTHDWRMELAWFPTSPRRVLSALSRARPRDVILLHDRQKTARCLPRIVDALDCRKLVSVPLSSYEGVVDGSPLEQSPHYDSAPAAVSAHHNSEGILDELLEDPLATGPSRHGLSGSDPVAFFSSPPW
jgi:peptidoglycan-N-acetylglucosamine deacetylase